MICSDRVRSYTINNKTSKFIQQKKRLIGAFLMGAVLQPVARLNKINIHMDIFENKNKILKQYKAPIIKLADIMNIKTKNGSSPSYVYNADVVI